MCSSRTARAIWSHNNKDQRSMHLSHMYVWIYNCLFTSSLAPRLLFAKWENSLVNCLHWFCYKSLLQHANWSKNAFSNSKLWDRLLLLLSVTEQPCLYKGARIAYSTSVSPADRWYTVWNVIFSEALSRGLPCDVMKKNSHHVGVWDRSFYGDLHELSDILILLLICVEYHCYIS